MNPPTNIGIPRRPIIASIEPKKITLSIRKAANDYLGSESIATINIQYICADQRFEHGTLLSALRTYDQVIGKPESSVVYIAIFASPTKRWGIGDSVDLSAVIHSIYQSGYSYGVLTVQPWLFVSADTHIPSQAFISTVPIGASPTTSPPLRQILSPPTRIVTTPLRRVPAASPSTFTTTQTLIGGDPSNQGHNAGEDLNSLMREVENHSQRSVVREDTTSPSSGQKRRCTHKEQLFNQKLNQDKVNKNGTKSTPRQPRPKLIRWDDNDWKNLCLGMVWACGAAGIDIAFEEAAKLVGPTVTQSAAQQAILKLRNQQIENGFYIPQLTMKWTRKAKKGASGEHGANYASSESQAES